MRINILFVLFLGLSISGIGQIQSKEKTLKIIALQARVIDLMPFEVSYMHLQNNGFSYALKAGFGIGTKNEMDNNLVNVFASNFYNSSSFRNVYSGAFDMNQSFVGYFIKPGIVIAKNKNPIIRSVHLLNYCISQSKDRLELVSDDQLFGKLKQTYEETNTYQAVELEGNFAFHRGSSFEVSFGYLLGYKLHNPIPFTSVIKGIEQGSTYSPGQGVGRKAYVNFFIGLAYKL